MYVKLYTYTASRPYPCCTDALLFLFFSWKSKAVDIYSWTLFWLYNSHSCFCNLVTAFLRKEDKSRVHSQRRWGQLQFANDIIQFQLVHSFLLSQKNLYLIVPQWIFDAYVPLRNHCGCLGNLWLPISAIPLCWSITVYKRYTRKNDSWKNYRKKKTRSFSLWSWISTSLSSWSWCSRKCLLLK